MFFAVRYATVQAWFQAWTVGKLAEGHGAAAAQGRARGKKAGAWLGEATQQQQVRTLLPRLHREFSLTLSMNSLRRLVQRLGYCWKRCRRSLKAQRDAQLFDFFQQELRLLHQAEQRAEVTVVCVKECCVSRQAPAPYAWQRRGAPAVAAGQPGAGPQVLVLDNASIHRAICVQQRLRA